MNIITLTLNPAIDVHCYSEKFVPFSENLFDVTSNDAGGKGINISRALNVANVKNTAVVVVGNENGNDFLKKLDDEKISYKEITLSGRIRENITLHTKNAPETRISFSGFSSDNSLIDKCEKILNDEDLSNAIITVTGRLPDGVDIGYVKDFIKRLKKHGAKIVIDSRSFKKEDIIECSPWLIKPNEEEIKMYTDLPVDGIDSAVLASQKLKSCGIENVMISLGGDGAVLSTDSGTYVANAPKIEVVSTIGAGDSSIAGFIAAISHKKSYKEALRYAIDYGSAACCVDGTQAPRLSDIERFYNEVFVKEV
ncbi:MAG: hexose kinase [Clostridia bacterium]|nr:hexose kinase [Clostridia bacterium]